LALTRELAAAYRACKALYSGSIPLAASRSPGTWIDPGLAETPLAHWSEEFLALARRLAPGTQETYRRDLTKYVLPALGAYRIGAVPPDVIENWLNDEIEAGVAPSSVHRHYRTLRRVLQVAVDEQKILTNPCDRVQPPRMPEREMVFLDWEQAVDLAEAHSERFRALIDLAVDSGMRWRPQAQQRGPGHRRRGAPQGDPGSDGSLVDQRDPRPLRPSVP
jgi:integrase